MIIVDCILITWAFIGFLGLVYHRPGKINWFGILFYVSAPFLAFITLLLD